MVGEASAWSGTDSGADEAPWPHSNINAQEWYIPELGMARQHTEPHRDAVLRQRQSSSQCSQKHCPKPSQVACRISREQCLNDSSLVRNKYTGGLRYSLARSSTARRLFS